MMQYQAMIGYFYTTY